MKLLPLLEGVSGVLTGLVGGATLAYLLLVPVYRGTGCVTLPGQPPDCEATYATLLNGADPGTRLQVTLVVVLLVGLGAAALWHARTGQAGARTALWGTTGILTLWTLCPYVLPYPLLLPSLAVAVAASAAAAKHPSDTVT
jgi:hypothetical protein